MRPAEARAARVGQGGTRVAECVCVRLSVNADSTQVIGRAQPARPALHLRPLVDLNTKAPARPALRVGPVVRAWEAGASTTSRLWDLSVPFHPCPRGRCAGALKALGAGAHRVSWNWPRERVFTRPRAEG